MSVSTLFTADEAELAEHYPNRAEHVADLLVHAVGILAAVVGGGALFISAVTHGGASISLAVAVYAACLIVMMACSAVYNLTRPSPARRMLRRMDEAAIFLMIAGSYTPFVIKLLDRPFDIAAAAFIWALAFAGVIGKLFVTHLSDRFWCYAYVAFGWLAVLILGPVVTGLPLTAAILMAGGGLVYSAGVLFFLKDGLPFRRAIWHSFVVAGAALHFAAVAQIVG